MPMLVLLPEKEQVVSKSKIAFAASHLPNADLVEIKSGKHELFNEQTAIDKIVWDHIPFLGQAGSLGGKLLFNDTVAH